MDSPFQFAVPNLPGLLALSPPTIDTVLTVNITAPGGGVNYCVTGIDMSFGVAGGTCTASYQIGTNARVYFGDTTIDVASPVEHMYASWRGAFLIVPAAILHLRLETLLPCDLAIVAFGYTVHAPVP
jgi:hypothetical protein